MNYTKLFAALALVSLLVAPVLAAQNGSSNGPGIQDQNRARDGSCGSCVCKADMNQDRARDGSCDGSPSRDQDRDRLRDERCQTST